MKNEILFFIRTSLLQAEMPNTSEQKYFYKSEVPWCLYLPAYTGKSIRHFNHWLMGFWLLAVTLVLTGVLHADMRDTYRTTTIYGPQGDDPFSGLGGIRGQFGTHVAIGDLDRDLTDDVAASEKDSVRVIFGEKDGSLANKSINLQSPSSQVPFRSATILTPGFVSDVAIANFLGNRWPELVCSNGATVYVIRSDSALVGATVDLSTVSTTRGFAISCGPASGQYGRALCAIDWNNDGVMDIAIGSRSSVSIFNGTALAATGSASLSSALLATFSTGEVESLAAGDVNGDGRKDLVVGCPLNLNSNDAFPNYGQAFVYLNGAPSATVTISGLGSIRSCGQRVACDDASPNRDGRAEVLVGAPDRAGRAAFMYGAATLPTHLTMANLVELMSGESVGSALGVLDLDLDGQRELIFGKPEDNTISPPPLFRFAGNVFINFSAGALTLSSLAPFDRYGKGDITSGNFFGDGVPAMAVGSYEAVGPTGNGQGAVFITTTGLGNANGSALYRAWTVAGDGYGPQVVPASTFSRGCTAEIDFSDGDFGDGGVGTGAGGPSLETVTAFRNITGVTPPMGASTQLVPYYWQIDTTRRGWTSARVTFQYPALIGPTAQQLGQSLKIWRASSPSGPWTPLFDQQVDTDRNEISALTTDVGYFCLSLATDIRGYEYYQDFESVSVGAAPGAANFIVSNGGATTGSSHPYWAIESNANVRIWGAALTRFGTALNGFNSTIGANGNRFLAIFWDPTNAQSDIALAQGIALKAGVTYQANFDFETPTSPPTGQGSDFRATLYQLQNNTYSPIRDLQVGDNLRLGKVFLTRDFTVSVDGTYGIGFVDVSNVNTSFYTAVDNVIVKKLNHPASTAPVLQGLTSILAVAPGTTMPATQLAAVSDADDAVSRLSNVVNGWPSGLIVNATIANNVISVSIVVPANYSPGLYSLTLLSSDPSGANANLTVPLWVTASDYQQWAAGQFPSSVFTNVTNTTWNPNADYDSDGRSNFFQYAFGVSATQSANLVPTLSLEGGEQFESLTMLQRRSSGGLVTYEVGMSTDLSTWQPLPSSWTEFSRVDLGNGYDQVTLKNSVARDLVTSRFYRSMATYHSP